ncbi:OprD family porin, partial [Pseudomonas borbori]
AAFLEDSKASIEARNFYFNRDFREDAGQSKQEEWAQGFLLRLESGYTEGTVGFGVDALGTLGFKLDSGDGTSGSGLLNPDRSGGSQDYYGGLGLTAKAKISESVLKVGSLQLKNQAIGSSDSRLLPQVFRGGNIVSKDIAGLTLDAGYLDEVNNRNSADYEDMTLNQFTLSGITFGGNPNQSNEFIFAGGNYKLTDSLTGGYYYSNLEDMYKQHSFNLVHVLPLGDKQSLKTDLRYARSTDDGVSNVDNKAFGAMVTYALSGHSLGLGYQKMSGDTGFAYVGGTDPFLVNYVQIGNFAAKDETSWQARYDFNFASIGIPGLTFMTRYLTGDNIDRGALADGKEWERNMDIAYVVQEGTFKNLGLKWRNATMRNNFGRDIDENRLIVSYTLPLL